MGLLDEAIREHLELKRRRGADPGEVARQEHEVLGTSRWEQREPGDAPEAAQPAGEPPAPSLAPAPEHWLDEPDAPHGPETAELDMEPLLDDDEHGHESPPPPPPEAHAPAPAPTRAEPEHDVLGEPPDFLEETSEHDRLWFEQQPPRDFDFDR